MVMTSTRTSKRKAAIFVGFLVAIALGGGLLALKHHNETQQAKHTTTIPSHKPAVSPNPAPSNKVTSNQGNEIPSSHSEKSTPLPSQSLQTPSNDGLVSN